MKVDLSGYHFSLGFELVLKSALLKNQVDIFEEKSKQYKIQKKNSLTGGRSFLDMGVTSNDPWLKSLLANKGINSIYELSTLTLGGIKFRNLLDHLESRAKITSSQKSEIDEALNRIAFFRRNRDMHFFFGFLNLSDNNDLESLFLPAVNLLLKC